MSKNGIKLLQMLKSKKLGVKSVHTMNNNYNDNEKEIVIKMTLIVKEQQNPQP